MERINSNLLSLSIAEGQHSGTMTHVLFWLLSFLGVPDHKGGAVLLLIGLLLSILLRNSQRHLAVDIGGIIPMDVSLDYNNILTNLYMYTI